MHIFTALLFTNDDSTVISTKKAQKQKTAKPKEKFQLQPFLKDKLLEPSVKKIYGMDFAIRVYLLSLVQFLLSEPQMNIDRVKTSNRPVKIHQLKW